MSFQVYGVVHLQPLPGAPRYEGNLGSVLERARRDASALLEGGVDGMLVENFGDVPFHPHEAPPETIAAMTRAAVMVRELANGRRLGVNVLRNDARGALAVAAACGGDFIRVNVHQGAVVADQGLLVGRAHETLRAREWLAPEVEIFADASVKHAAPLASRPLRDEVADLVERGLADAVIVTGAATGRAVAERDLVEAREGAAGAPLWIGSGFDPDLVEALVPLADGAIVGTFFESEGRAGAPVDSGRVRALMKAIGR